MASEVERVVGGDGPQFPEGCTCQYGTWTPVWYASVRTCPVHSGSFEVAATPQWWLEGEARGWRIELPPRRKRRLTFAWIAVGLLGGVFLGLDLWLWPLFAPLALAIVLVSLSMLLYVRRRF